MSEVTPLGNSKLIAFAHKHCPDMTVLVDIMPARGYGVYQPKEKQTVLTPIGLDRGRSWVQMRCTLIHEMAHHLTPAVYHKTNDGRRGQWESHGDAWREAFSWLMHLAINDGLFGDDLTIQRAALNAAVTTNCAHAEICPDQTASLSGLYDLVLPS